MDANQLVVNELAIKIANSEVALVQLKVENHLLNEDLKRVNSLAIELQEELDKLNKKEETE